MKETLRHIEAFNYYYALGSKRSFKLVQSKFNVSNMSISRWSKAFNWQERIKERDRQNAEKLEAKVDKAVVQSKEDYRKLISEVVEEFKEKLKEGKIRIEKPEDLVAIAKLDLLLMGEGTGEQGHTFTLTVVKSQPSPEIEEAIKLAEEKIRAKYLPVAADQHKDKKEEFFKTPE